MTVDIDYGKEARGKMLAGVTKLADAVKVTMGPLGRTVAIRHAGKHPHITKDGVTVARAIILKDPVEDMAVQIIKEVASNVAKEAGDGTTTATVLTHALITRGIDAIDKGNSPVWLKKGMERALVDVTHILRHHSIPIATLEDIERVSFISTNGDEELSKLIAEGIHVAGRYGVITVEKSSTIKTTLDMVDGISFDKGYTSAYFTNKGRDINMKDVKIIILGEKIEDEESISSILSTLDPKQHYLILTQRLDEEMLTYFINYRLAKLPNIVVVEAPGFGDRVLDIMEDIATLTGATVIDRTTDELTETLFGHAENINVSKHKTLIFAAGDKARVDNRIQSTKDAILTATSDFDKGKIEERLAMLTGGIGVIKVGAPTETELVEKIDRVDDALAACKSALEEGVVMGGGWAYVNAIKLLIEKASKGETPEDAGYVMVLSAITTPAIQILENAGHVGDDRSSILAISEDATGINALTGEECDMISSGIIDPLKVVRLALLNAISAAGTLLTTEATIVEEVGTGTAFAY